MKIQKGNLNLPKCSSCSPPKSAPIFWLLHCLGGAGYLERLQSSEGTQGAPPP